MRAQGASGAVSAKIRAMYGQRLTPGDYGELLAARTAGDVASILASHPLWGEASAAIKADGGGRGGVEDAVRRARFRQFERLCRFGFAAGERLADWIVSSVELGTLERAIRRITPGVTDPVESGSYTGSDFFDSHLSFDPDEVFAADSAEKIAEAAKRSRFYRALSSADGDPVRLGAALRAEYWRGAVDIFETAGAEEVAGMFRDRIDLENVVVAVRLKKYFKAEAGSVAAALIPGGNMKPSTLRALAEAEGEDGVLAAARSDGRTARLLGILDECSVIDEAPERATFRKSCRLIRYSPSPAAVTAGYYGTTAAEAANIVKITEGKRYGVPPDEIKRMLIAEKEERGEVTDRWRS